MPKKQSEAAITYQIENALKPSQVKKAKHEERHFTARESVRDMVIGMSDGLTVPFALAAGLSGASASCALILAAGVAEIAAGAIAMGLGGYMAAKTDAEHYERELRRERQEVIEIPEEEKAEVRQVFREYGLTDEQIVPIVLSLTQRPNDWVKFMMRFELGIERPNPQRAIESAITISVSYIIGGLIPLFPYILMGSPQNALLNSIWVTAIALYLFGYLRGWLAGIHPMRTAVQTLFVGGIAAGVAFAIAKLVSNS